MVFFCVLQLQTSAMCLSHRWHLKEKHQNGNVGVYSVFMLTSRNPSFSLLYNIPALVDSKRQFDSSNISILEKLPVFPSIFPKKTPFPGDFPAGHVDYQMEVPMDLKTSPRGRSDAMLGQHFDARCAGVTLRLLLTSKR